MTKFYISCSVEKAKELAQWLRETYVFEGPNNTRDGYYFIEGGHITVEFLRDLEGTGIETFLRLKLGAGYEIF